MGGKTPRGRRLSAPLWGERCARRLITRNNTEASSCSSVWTVNPWRTMTRRLSLAALVTSLLLLSGCASSSSPQGAEHTGLCAGVRVVVNYGLLGSSGKSSDVVACARTASKITIGDALAAVDISTEGTSKYGDQVVCRVNNLPAADTAFSVPGHDPYTESCSTMAPEFAYWALWVKKGLAAWAYATEGASTALVNPGDSVGLVFTTGGATPTPVG